MSPLNWYLSRFQPESVRQEEQLRVETPSFNLLAGKDRFDRAAVERLEAALGVFVFQPQYEAQSEIKKSAEQLPKQGLALGLKFALHPPRANSNIRTLSDCVEQLVGFGDR